MLIVSTPTNPPSCNTGGTQVLPRGDHPQNQGSQSQKTIIDTISWTIPDQVSPARLPPEDETPDQRKRRQVYEAAVAKIKPANIKPLLALVLDAFPEGCEWTSVGPGKHGYPFQTQLIAGSLVLGWVAFGAPHGKHWLYLTGTGLRHRRDAGLTDESLASFCDLPGARLGRVDIALDLYDHAVFSVEASILAHETGGYKLPRAPQNPYNKLIQSDSNCSDYPLARTHYIGREKAKKGMRIYDKGLQLLGSLSADELAEYQQRGIVRADPTPAGSRLEEWTRVELIYRHDKLRPLTPDMIIDRDRTFAGAYPVLAELLGRSDGVRPSYIPKDEDCELAKLIEAGRASYGGLIYFLRNERGFTDEDIIKELIGTKSAARLMVDKERPDAG